MSEHSFKSLEHTDSICLNEAMEQDHPSLGRRFLTVWLGQTASTIGSTLSAIGVAVFVFVETGSTAWLGVLIAAAAAPFVLVTPLLPVIDRFERRAVMILADVLAGSGTVVALALALTGRLQLWHLIVTGFVGGVGTALQVPAFQAAIPQLVVPSALDRANGLTQLGAAAGVVVGPAIATPLVAWWGIEAVLLVDLVTFAVAVAATTSVRFSSEPVVSVADGDAVDDGSWAAARTWLGSHGRPLVGLLVAMAVVNFCLAGFNVAVLSLATEVGGPARSGLVLGAGGLAMLAGTLVIGQRGLPERRIRAAAGSLLAIAVGCAIAAFRPSFALVVVGVVVSLGLVPAASASISTVFHEWVPPSMQGRVFGLRGAIGRSLEPIGSVVAGFAIVHLATPVADADGGFAALTDVLIGEGAGRGPALALVAIGLALAGLAVGLWRSSVMTAIDDRPAQPAPVRQPHHVPLADADAA